MLQKTRKRKKKLKLEIMQKAQFIIAKKTVDELGDKNKR